MLFKKKEKGKNISENKVRIEVFRLLGGNIPYSIALFEAIQDKDSDNNLVLVNQSNSFKDDVEIVKNKMITDLEFTLNFSTLPDEKKINTVKERIKQQEEIIRSSKDGYYSAKKVVNGKEVVEKIKINIIDEELRLNKYKVFLESILVQANSEGSYESIDFDGVKRVYYTYKEGLLYPVKYLKASNTMYTDVTTKRKIYKQEQDLIDQEYLNDNRGFFSGWKMYLALGMFIIFFIVNVYWSVQLYQGYNEFDEGTLSQLTEMAEGSAIKCSYWYTQNMEKTAQILNNYENIIKEEEHNNTNIVSVG